MLLASEEIDLWNAPDRNASKAGQRRCPELTLKQLNAKTPSWSIVFRYQTNGPPKRAIRLSGCKSRLVDLHIAPYERLQAGVIAVDLHPVLVRRPRFAVVLHIYLEVERA